MIMYMRQLFRFVTWYEAGDVWRDQQMLTLMVKTTETYIIVVRRNDSNGGIGYRNYNIGNKQN